MYQSITHLIINKRVFCHDTKDLKVLLLNFTTKKQKYVENFEIWSSDLSPNEIDMVGKVLLQMSDDIVNQERVIFFRCLPNIFGETLRKHSLNSELNLAYEKNLNCCFFNDNIDLLEVRSVKGFEVSNIPPENAGLVMKRWKYGSTFDIDWVTKSITTCPSLGIWDSSSNNMIGQFIYMTTGTFGSLYVDNEYRGMGLAKLLTMELLKLTEKRNMEILIEIEDDNIVSKCFFENMKFLKISETICIVFDKVGNLPIPGTDF